MCDNKLHYENNGNDNPPPCRPNTSDDNNSNERKLDNTAGYYESQVDLRKHRKSTGSIDKIISDLGCIERRRESYVREIQNIVDKCKERVEDLKKCLQEDEEASEDYEGSYGSSNSNRSSAEEDCLCNLLTKENLLMMGGIGMLLFLLQSNMCFKMLPPFPSLYGFMYRLTVQLHFQYALLIPVFRDLCLKRWLSKETYERIEYKMMQWYYSVAVALSIVALVMLLMRKCWIHNFTFYLIFSTQVTTIVATFLLELRGLCYLTPKSSLVRMPSNLCILAVDKKWSITERQLMSYVSIALLAVNTTFMN